MREIKFRAWHKEAREMLFVGDQNGTTHPLACCVYFMDGQPVELMQFTGLLDKNGVEIYEGDILRTSVNKHFWVYVVKPVDQYPNGPLYAIQDHNNCGTAIDEDGDEIHDYTISTRARGTRKNLVYESKFEVIGNIHQNPELLEG